MPRIAAAVTVVIAMGMCIGFNTVRYPVVWKMVAAAHQTPGTEKSVPRLQSTVLSEPGWSREPAAPLAMISDSADSGFGSASVDPIPFPSSYNPTDNQWQGEDGWTLEDVAEATPGDPVVSPVSENSEDVLSDPADDFRNSHEPVSSGYRANPFGERDTAAVEAAPSRKYASGTADASFTETSISEDRLAGVNRRPLVPVARVPSSRYNQTVAGGNQSAEFGVASQSRESRDPRVRRLPPLDQTAEPTHQTPQPEDDDGPMPIYPSTHGD